MYTIFRLGMVSDWLRVSEPVTFDWSDSWQHSLMGALVSKLQDTRSPGTSEEHDTVTVDMTPLNINTSTPRHIVHLVMASDWSIVNMWPGYWPLIGQLPGVLSTLSCHCVKSYLMSTIHTFSFWISLLGWWWWVSNLIIFWEPVSGHEITLRLRQTLLSQTQYKQWSVWPGLINFTESELQRALTYRLGVKFLVINIYSFWDDISKIPWILVKIDRQNKIHSPTPRLL